jgi:nucleotide-binding universal stress UspA family protein
MKKIIIAFDGKHFSEGAMQMASWINEQEPALMTGVFLSPIDYREVIGYTGMGMGTPVVMPPFQEDDALVKANISRFQERCEKEGFEYRIHKDTELFALQELINETRFADLLILSSELFYENIDHHQPNDYLKKTLQSSECPVMLVPEHFLKPFNIVFSYDGKASSVFAMRQFTYLFPSCGKMDAMVVCASEESDAEIPQAALMEELVARHYESVTIEHLAGENREGLTRWINERRGSLLVTGAFGRGELSSIFRKSFVTDLIRQHRIPIFIAHR